MDDPSGVLAAAAPQAAGLGGMALGVAAPAAPPAASSSGSFACTHPGCGKSFGRRSNLDAHARVAHGGERHICPHPGCGKALRHKNRLASHLALHATYVGQEDELRQRYPKPLRVRSNDRQLRDALAECRLRELALGGRATCPGCGRSFAPQGFGPHLALCARAHVTVLAGLERTPPQAGAALAASDGSAPASAGAAGAGVPLPEPLGGGLLSPPPPTRVLPPAVRAAPGALPCEPP